MCFYLIVLVYFSDPCKKNHDSVTVLCQDPNNTWHVYGFVPFMIWNEFLLLHCTCILDFSNYLIVLVYFSDPCKKKNDSITVLCQDTNNTWHVYGFVPFMIWNEFLLLHCTCILDFSNYVCS